MALTVHPLLAPGSRVCGVVISPPSVPAWYIRGQIYPVYSYDFLPTLLYLHMCGYISCDFSNLTVLFWTVVMSPPVSVRVWNLRQFRLLTNYTEWLQDKNYLSADFWLVTGTSGFESCPWHWLMLVPFTYCFQVGLLAGSAVAALYGSRRRRNHNGRP